MLYFKIPLEVGRFTWALEMEQLQCLTPLTQEEGFTLRRLIMLR